MAIQKQFILRYRQEGHARFEIPELFCDKAIADALTGKLSAVDGIYRVKVYRSQRKLSVRFQETVCDFNRMAKLLFQFITELEKGTRHENNQKVPARTRLRVKNKFKQLKITSWFSRKYGDAKETVQAARILTKVGLNKQRKLFNDPEKAMIDFFNDILVLFLIRLHWDHITKEWIPRPIKYRYEWMAIFYMIFLLVRSRKPK